jgi:hypothetical protein
MFARGKAVPHGRIMTWRGGPRRATTARSLRPARRQTYLEPLQRAAGSKSAAACASVSLSRRNPTRARPDRRGGPTIAPRDYRDSFATIAIARPRRCLCRSSSEAVITRGPKYRTRAAGCGTKAVTRRRPRRTPVATQKARRATPDERPLGFASSPYAGSTVAAFSIVSRDASDSQARILRRRHAPGGQLAAKSAPRAARSTEPEVDELEKLGWLLSKATRSFGERPVSDLRPAEIAAWRMTIPPGHRFEATQALRQTLSRATRPTSTAWTLRGRRTHPPPPRESTETGGTQGTKTKPSVGLEPTTPSLPWKCSTS